MSLRIIGTTLLGAAGLCGSAAVWAHTHNSQALEARGHSRETQFSRRERRESNFARDYRPGRRRGGARGWEDRGR